MQKNCSIDTRGEIARPNDSRHLFSVGCISLFHLREVPGKIARISNAEVKTFVAARMRRTQRYRVAFGAKSGRVGISKLSATTNLSAIRALLVRIRAKSAIGADLRSDWIQADP